MRAKRVLAGLSDPSTSSITELAAFVRRMRWTLRNKIKSKQALIIESSIQLIRSKLRHIID
jgi:hypothetical protein